MVDEQSHPSGEEHSRPDNTWRDSSPDRAPAPDEPLAADLVENEDAAATPASGQQRRSHAIEAEVLDAPANTRGASPLREQPRRRQRRKRLPLILFLLTCLSTFWVGATGWMPLLYVAAALQSADAMPLRRAMIRHWADGLLYMCCVIAILLTHEMGHFLMAVRHRVHASLPYFLPIPINAIGTLGAVIAMDSLRADRKEIFNIGLAGPIAGLIVAVPLMMVGVQHLDLTTVPAGGIAFESPLAVRWMLDYFQPPGYAPGAAVWVSQLNPYFMAGWVGFFVTGLNMLPVSQLDGGHVTYTLFGKRAHWIARAFMVAAIAYVVFRFETAQIWIPMIFLVMLLLGTDHPPTRDDTVPLSWLQKCLGIASLAIPILCFTPTPIAGL